MSTPYVDMTVLTTFEIFQSLREGDVTTRWVREEVERRLFAADQEIDRLRAALSWYADGENWSKGRGVNGHHRSQANWDSGEIARAALVGGLE